MLNASQSSRRQLISDALRIEWNGFTDQYSAELWMHLQAEAMFAERYGESRDVYFGGKRHTLTLTDIEDLCELCRKSYISRMAV